MAVNWNISPSRLIIIVFIVIAAAVVYANPRGLMGKAAVYMGWIEAPEPKVVKEIKRVEVKVPVVQVIEKEKIIKEYDVPDEVKLDVAKEILAITEVPAWKGKTRVTATLDVNTGEPRLYTKKLPPPFFEFINEKEFGMRYGFSDEGESLELAGRWQPVRIGGIYLGFYGEGNTNGHFKLMADLSYRF